MNQELRTHKKNIEAARARGGYKRLKPFHPRREARRSRALEQNKNQLAPKDQLLALDLRLGEGVGAKRERARLAKLIDKEN